MSEHDMASAVAQAAGLGGTKEGTDLIQPARLIERFCGEEAAGLRADPGTTSENGVATSRGWCGFRGGRGESIETGFDDGYDWLGYLTERGWRALHAKGDWPLVVYLVWAHKGEKPAIAEYLEGDLTVWVFDTPELAKRHYKGLRDIP